MSLLGFVASAAGAWMVLACVGGTSWALVATRLKRRRADVVRRPSYPPPVPHPPVTQAEIDACWLDAWPTEMPQEQCDRLFDELIAIEGLQ